MSMPPRSARSSLPKRPSFTHDALCRLVNYEQLPEILWTGLDRHFGIAFGSEDITLMQRQAGYHSKLPGQTFQNDSERKQREASGRLELLAEQWVMPHYRRLEEIRQGQSE